MTKRASEGKMKGEQDHAEGNHGPVTRSRIAEESHEPAAGRSEAGPRDADHGEHPRDGRHRLFEGREQHDEADQQSDRNRRDRDVERHGHDGEQR